MSFTSDLDNIKDKLPLLLIFFKNMQKEIHLYLLESGEEVTANKIEYILHTIFQRGFSSSTYYDLRKYLKKEGLIMEGEEDISGKRGPMEKSHRLIPAMHDRFRLTMISDGLITRPVELSRFHIMELSILYSRILKTKAKFNFFTYLENFEKYLNEYKSMNQEFLQNIFFPISLITKLFSLFLLLTDKPSNYYMDFEDIGIFKEINIFYKDFPDIVEYTYKQKHFHYYLLINREEITASKIKEFSNKIGKNFSSTTYFSLRKILYNKGFIIDGEEESSNIKGSREKAHRIRETKRTELQQELVHIGIIERPITISKYHLFILGRRLSYLKPEKECIRNFFIFLKQINMEIQLRKQICYIPGYLYTNIIDILLEAIKREKQELIEKVSESLIKAQMFTGMLLSVLVMNNRMKILLTKECHADILPERYRSRRITSVDIDDISKEHTKEDNAIYVKIPVTVDKSEKKRNPVIINLFLKNNKYYLHIFEPEIQLDPPLHVYCRLLKKNNGLFQHINTNERKWNQDIILDKKRALTVPGNLLDTNLIISFGFKRIINNQTEYIGEFRLEINTKDPGE
ncbi:MAG: hypothetical protein JXB88_01680 [Spirochaetales bacterium]|nr:hypothetical protein [Spirochaetales bacterium]